jgi:hypothetical protein
VRTALIVLAAAAAVAACTSTAQPGPPHTTAPVPPLLDTAAVFVAVLGAGTVHGSARTLVFDHTVCSQALRQQPCTPVPIPDSVQDQVVRVLGPEVVFTAKPPTRLSLRDQIVVTLGAPKIGGDRATVTVETNCGPLCGAGQVVVLARRGDGWVRTGTTGPHWIS